MNPAPGSHQLNPRNLRVAEAVRLLNATPLGEVVQPHVVYRHLNRAAYKIGDGKCIDLVRYAAWLFHARHETPGTSGGGGPLFVGGELQCDAFAGYGGLFDAQGPWHMIHIGCWAHARRKFHEARYNAPAPACHAMGLIRQLYEIEATTRMRRMTVATRCDKPNRSRRSMRSSAGAPISRPLRGCCPEARSAKR